MTRAQLLENLPSRLDEPVRWHECEDEEFRWLLECERRRLRLEQFANIESLDDQEEAERIEWQICAMDTRHWIENYAFIESPHENDERVETPLVLWEAQLEKALPAIEDAIDHGKDLPVTKGRKLGMSWLVLVSLYHRFCFRSRFSARCASRVQDNVDDFTPESLFGKFRFLHARLPEFLRPHLVRDNHMHIEAANGSRLMGESTNNGLARGKRCTVLYFDEYAHIQPQMQRQIKLASTTVARTRIWTSTPNGPGDHFADMVKNHPNLLRMTFEDNPTFTPEFINAERQSLGPEMFAQEYKGEVQSLSGALIWHCRRPKTQYDDQDIRFNIPKLRTYCDVVCGWDFGQGASRLVNLWALRENLDDGKFRLFVDDDQWWQGATWRVAAQETKDRKAERYRDNSWEVYGDPSGVSKESNQESWATNLQAGEVPMVCLPLEWNNQRENEWGIKFVQGMIDDGRLLIHERCRDLWECIEGWRRAIREGQTFDDIDRAYIRPKHDKFSHHGMALVYLVRGAYEGHKALGGGAAAAAPPPSRRGTLATLREGRGKSN